MAKKKKEMIHIPKKVMINGVEMERFGDEVVTLQNVAEASKEYSCLFGANKNVYRIAPSLQDGLVK